MYKLMLKYKRVIINAIILVASIFVSTDFHKDFLLGAAAAAVLISLGESIGNLRIEKNENGSSKKIYSY
jgi:hypothetical protein